MAKKKIKVEYGNTSFLIDKSILGDTSPPLMKDFIQTEGSLYVPPDPNAQFMAILNGMFIMHDSKNKDLSVLESANKYCKIYDCQSKDFFEEVDEFMGEYADSDPLLVEMRSKEDKKCIRVDSKAPDSIPSHIVTYLKDISLWMQCWGA